MACQNLLKSSRERATLKRKCERKIMFDKSLSQSISVDNEKKILRQNNVIEHKQLISAVKNFEINSKSSLFEKFVVIKNSLIF